jgi:hypothetical protein
MPCQCFDLLDLWSEITFNTNDNKPYSNYKPREPHTRETVHFSRHFHNWWRQSSASQTVTSGSQWYEIVNTVLYDM